jgi:SanA protein
MARRRHPVLFWTLAALGLAAVGVLGPFIYMELAHRADVFLAEDVPKSPLAIVFGAGLGPQGAPSPLLAARVRTAVQLYRAGKVERVLLSGSSEPYHDELSAMKRLAADSGLPPEALWVDTEGLSTYDTCLRAHNLFGARDVILVTQRFHMPRALFLASAVGLHAHGVLTSPGARPRLRFLVRELFARPLAIGRAWAPQLFRRTPPASVSS